MKEPNKTINVMIFSYSRNKHRTRIKNFFPPKADLLKEQNMNNEVKEVKPLQSFVHLGELLRVEREKQGLSIEEVAKLADWSERSVRKIEEGKNMGLRLGPCFKIAEILNCNIAIVDKA